MVLEAAAEAAGISVGIASYGIFGYNRQNFMLDRKQRQKQEIKIAEKRLDQVDLWRRDIRDVVGLTEKKMDLYMVVTAVQIGFNVMMVTHGRLEIGTPEWLLWLHSIALGGAFLFQLLALWFAMHASVVAQAASTRMLSQLVRLPVPSWDVLESMRTYGAGFEGVSASTMLRVPVLQTVTEGYDGGAGGHAARAVDADATPRPSLIATLMKSSDQTVRRPAADPWGLEREGLNIPELKNRSLSSLPHVKILVDAAVHWQSYDAFARVAMNLGTILQCKALSYFAIGYVLVQDGSPWACVTTVACFMAVASSLLCLDISASKKEYWTTVGCLCAGPLLACIAAIDWATYDDLLQNSAIVFLPASFGFNGAFMLCYIRLCGVCEQMPRLPIRFRHVLYMDVYEWLRRRREDSKDNSSSEGNMSDDSTESCTFNIHGSTSCQDAWSSSSVSPIASSLRQSIKDLGVAFASRVSASFRGNGQILGRERLRRAKVHAMTFPRHFGQASPTPLRPEDVDLHLFGRGDPGGRKHAHEYAYQEFVTTDICDHVGWKGANNKTLPGVGVPGITPTVESAGKSFEGVTYIPGVSRLPPNDRDRHGPVELPRLLVLQGSWLFVLLWFAGSTWSVAVILQVPSIKDAELPESVSFAGGRVHEALKGGFPNAVKYDSLHAERRIHIDWPNARFQPWGVSVDSSGKHFAISDEFEFFGASLTKSNGELFLRSFRIAPLCLATEGEAVRDIAVACHQDNEGSDSVIPAIRSRKVCKAFVLHARGRKLAECEIIFSSGSAATAFPGTLASQNMSTYSGRYLQDQAQLRSWDISPKWLRKQGDDLQEEVISAAVDADCFRHNADDIGAGWPCIVVGTSLERIIRLRTHLQDKRVLVPSDVLWNVVSSRLKTPTQEVWGTSMLQTLPNGNLVSLCNSRRSVHAINMTSRQVVGRWMLPHHFRRRWIALAGGDSKLFLTSQDDDGSDAQIWEFQAPGQLLDGNSDPDKVDWRSVVSPVSIGRAAHQALREMRSRRRQPENRTSARA